MSLLQLHAAHMPLIRHWHFCQSTSRPRDSSICQMFGVFTFTARHPTPVPPPPQQLAVSFRSDAYYLPQLLHAHFLISTRVLTKRPVHMAFWRKKSAAYLLGSEPHHYFSATSQQFRLRVPIQRMLLSGAAVVLSQETTTGRKKSLCLRLVICVFRRFE